MPAKFRRVLHRSPEWRALVEAGWITVSVIDATGMALMKLGED